MHQEYKHTTNQHKLKILKPKFGRFL